MSRSVRTLKVTDVHVGGDVHQIVLGGIAPLPGATLLEQRDQLRDHHDDLRRILLDEPRGGHPSLFADLVVPARDPRARAGFIIMEYLGYPLFSGSNTMATAIALVEEGRIPLADGAHDIVLESPGGLIEVAVEVAAGKVTRVTFGPDDTASVVCADARVYVEGRGDIRYDLVWAGCWYAVVRAEPNGFALKREEEAAQGQFAFELMQALAREPRPLHPLLGDQGGINLVLFAAEPAIDVDGRLSRRISPVVYPRSVSRCPAGTGTTAAVAQLVARGQMREGQTMAAISSWDTRFTGECYRVDASGGVRVQVSGQGWIIARKEIILDDTDPLTPTAGLYPLLEELGQGDL